MEAGDFAQGSPGRLVATPERVQAFVPGPLPPSLDWEGELVAVLSAADRALGRLDGICRPLPNPHLLIMPFVRREAVLSSRIGHSLPTGPQ